MDSSQIKLKEVVPAHLVVGWKKKLVFAISMVHILFIAVSSYRNPLTAWMVLNKLMKMRKRVNGKLPIPRYIKSNGRYYWSSHSPGWPSMEFNIFIKNELNRIRPFKSGNNSLQTMIFAVTNKCHLSCEHCFEWDNLNTAERLSLMDLKSILDKFQKRGISQVQLSGGEPLARFNDLLELMKSAQSGTDFWLLTSGLGLTYEKALQLKEAGLAGVNISLDHWSETRHNAFRNNEKSFYWVKEAAANCRNVDLVVCFSICTVQDFISRENLIKYLTLAKTCGAGFIQLLEPRKVGHFADKNVELNDQDKNVLENFYFEINSDPAYRDMPTVMYPGYHQRKFGCFGAGNRYLYVDPNGEMHACPFCQTKVGNALTNPLDTGITQLKEKGCQAFNTLLNDLN